MTTFKIYYSHMPGLAVVELDGKARNYENVHVKVETFVRFKKGGPKMYISGRCDDVLTSADGKSIVLQNLKQ